MDHLQNPSLDAGTDAAPDQPCCQARAISVPIATYTVDIGLPLLLLLISCLVLRYGIGMPVQK